MHTLAQLLAEKGNQVYSVTPDSPVIEAIRVMADKGIGAVLVINAGGELVGVLSERDYARKVVLKGRASSTTEVEAIMSYPVVCLPSSASVDEAMALMTQRKFRHLPVLGGGGDVIGVVSLGDLVATIIEDQAHQIEQLEHYISG